MSQHTAAEVMNALKRRHAADVFIPECNLGSATRGCRRMDAWAMPKSWAPLRTIGYEVKVSRSDFTRDTKWHEYGDFVHELWFACPRDLIKPEELPPGVGLLYLSKTGGKLVAKQKAVRTLDIAKTRIVEVMAYALMSRVIVERPTVHGPAAEPASAQDWLEWAKGTSEHQQVAHLVREEIDRRVGDVHRENKELKSRIDAADELRGGLRRLGLDPDRVSSWNLESKVAEVRGLINPMTIGKMERLASSLMSMAADLHKQRNGA